MNNQVHAPYHFVPLSKWVYLPEWAHLVSHDYPFKDGLSGSIDISLKNYTELLVGAGSKKGEGSPSFVEWARTPHGELVIPGSSLKGMLRSFLEVATFSKFKQIDDNRYAYRDISGAKTKYSLTLQGTDEMAAWLRFDSEQQCWFYQSCDFTRLYNADFNEYLKKQGVNKVVDNGLNTQTATQKYKIWPLTKTPISFDLGEYYTEKESKKDCAKKLGSGTQKGFPVFVGLRPGESKDLNFNYIFFVPNETIKSYKIESELVNQMFAAHDEELVNYLKSNGHPKLGIPVFIRKVKRQNKIQAIGLARMPKMLYDKSVRQLADAQQNKMSFNDVAFDFCELVFGSLRDHGIGLKSRVGFSDLVCQNKAQTTKSSPVILGQPKASYLNAYLKQDHKNGNVAGELKMYEEGANLSGWKRYPTQSKFNADIPDDLKSKKNIQSQLELVKPGAEFSGKIIFHNLKAEELGALLWALNPSQSFYHGLGHGKSLGAGAVQLQTKLNLRQDTPAEFMDSNALVKHFIAHMNSAHPSSSATNEAWENSTQVLHLLAFGDMDDNRGKNLTYMPLQKKAGAVTYSTSKVSGTRKSLPKWRQGEVELERDESLGVIDDYAPRGRLYELVNKLVKNDDQKLSMEEARRKLKQAEEYAEELKQKKAEEANLEALKEDASPLFITFIDLRKFFEDKSGKDNELNPKHLNVTDLLQKASLPDSGLSKDELKDIVAFFNEVEPSRYLNAKTAKINPKKLRERKEFLQNVKELI